MTVCFDTVIFSYVTGYVKPEPEIYQIALDSLGVTAEESIFVGDGGSDEIRGAKEVGFTTVMTTEIISKLWPEKIDARAKYADYQNLAAWRFNPDFFKIIQITKTRKLKF